ncbi:restriction modification system DNA specificity subunit [Vibrio cholerae]|nr:restriction modification system DNA specificity subunit [Vibrio cholerae]
MTSDWFKLTLGDVCEKITDGAHKSPKSVDDGKPMASVKDLTRFGVDLSNARKISKEDFDDLVQQGCKPHVGDVLIAKDGNSALDTVCTVDSEIDAVLLSSVAILRPDPEMLDSNFLKYYFCSPQVIEYLKTNFISGAAIPRVVLRDFRKAEINLPPLSIQRKISQCLSSIDNKIFSNTQTNQTLEQMAQAIFKSWFVDFDPVKAKMNGEQPEGMDAVTASLFPEKLVESELGLIPEGWEIGTLDSHTSMIIDHRGKTPKKLGSDWVEEGYPAISAKNIKSKKIVRPDTIRFIDEVTYKKWMKEPLIKGDIIMTSEAPMGELYFFDGSQDFCLSQRLYGLRANSDICSPEFLFNWLQTAKAKSDMEGRASGTTALGIKQAELRKVKILTPPRELLEKYSVVASNLVDMAAKNNAQNTVLEDLRDTLLPKLLSGEIELGQTEEMAEVS